MRVHRVIVALAVLLGCRGSDSQLAAPARAICTEERTTSTSAFVEKSRVKPLRIQRMCVVRPPSAVEGSGMEGLVWVKTVFVETDGTVQRPIVFSFRCDWHENDLDVAAGRVRRSSWTCAQKEVALETIANGFSWYVLANSSEFGRIDSGQRMGRAKIDLYEREFVVDHIDTIFLPGRFALNCPRPLRELPGLTDALGGKGDPARTAGCEVVIENENTHERVTSPCDGQFEVPDVYVSLDREK